MCLVFDCLEKKFQRFQWFEAPLPENLWILLESTLPWVIELFIYMHMCDLCIFG